MNVKVVCILSYPMKRSELGLLQMNRELMYILSPSRVNIKGRMPLVLCKIRPATDEGRTDVPVYILSPSRVNMKGRMPLVLCKIRPATDKGITDEPVYILSPGRVNIKGRMPIAL